MVKSRSFSSLVSSGIDPTSNENEHVLFAMHFGKLRCRRMQNESKKSRGGGVISRYRSYLPVSETTPIVTLGEGSTPLVFAPRLSERIDCRVLIKCEGLNPTGSFNERGMTVAVSKAVESGAQALICACTGNNSAYTAGYSEYKQLGKSRRLPRMIGIQAEHAAPIFHHRVIEKPETIASAIRIGNPASWEAAKRAINDSSGAVEIVTDHEILEAQSWLAQTEGIFVEPASAAPIAGLLKLAREKRRDLMRKDATVVCTCTGHGLKDPEIVSAKLAAPVAPNIEAVREEITRS